MKKYLVIGNPIEHSLSPKLHNYWFEKNNIDANYDRRKTDRSEIQEIVNEIKDNKLARVSGNPIHPMTRGGLCVKLKNYEERHYHPERLLYPHKRVGKKGKKEFERITWEEALKTITDKWKNIINPKINSLNKSLKGSINDRFIFLGNPPTL